MMFGEVILWCVLLGKASAEATLKSDPVTRMQTLMYESENLRQKPGEIDRFWSIDQPSHLTPDRKHGDNR
jgi:hypothetical protein